MQIIRIRSFLGALGMMACQPAPVIEDPIQLAHQKAGVEIAQMDTSVSPRQDFYQYANGAWLNRTEIPKDKARIGAFMELNDQVELSLKAIMMDLEAQKEVEPGSSSQRLRDFY